MPTKGTNPETPRKRSQSKFCQEWPRQTKPNKGQFMNFSQGHSGTKVRHVNRACFPREEKHQNSQKKGEIHELLVLALSLVWFAGATPDSECPGFVRLEILKP